MRIAAVQFAPVFGRPDRNLQCALALMKKASADLYVLPELPFSGYFFTDRDECARLAEDPQRSPAVAALIAFARRRKAAIVTGFTELAASGVYNSALFIGPDGIEATYRKLHLFNSEKNYFDVGNLPLPVVEFGGARIGVMVCFDWALPEASRTLALAGAQIICQPANLVLDKCQRAMFARSVENGVFTVTANRSGSDIRPFGKLSFTGLSQIMAPNGERLVQASEDADEIVLADIDPAVADCKMITSTNHLLADRRPAYYRIY